MMPFNKPYSTGRELGNIELSVVSPCYGAPTLLRQLVKEITEVVAPLTKD